MKKSWAAGHRKRIGPPNRTQFVGKLFPSQVHNGIAISPSTPDGKRARVSGIDQGSSATAAVLDELGRALGTVTAGNHPRTFRLLQSGRRKLARKVIEEACEVTVEVVKRNPDGIVRESADLLYHLVALWFHTGIEPSAVWHEMQMRAGTLGLAEKLPKSADPKADAAQHSG